MMRIRRRVRTDDGIVDDDSKIAVRVGDGAIAGIAAIVVARHVGIIAYEAYTVDKGGFEIGEQTPDAV